MAEDDRDVHDVFLTACTCTKYTQKPAQFLPKVGRKYSDSGRLSQIDAVKVEPVVPNGLVSGAMQIGETAGGSG